MEMQVLKKSRSPFSSSFPAQCGLYLPAQKGISSLHDLQLQLDWLACIYKTFDFEHHFVCLLWQCISRVTTSGLLGVSFPSWVQ